jgi:hypothetical protein
MLLSGSNLIELKPSFEYESSHQLLFGIDSALNNNSSTNISSVLPLLKTGSRLNYPSACSMLYKHN